MNRTKCFLNPIIPSLLISVGAIGLTACILRNLGFLVGLLVDSGEGDKFDFVAIFSQTQDAALSLHWIVPLLCGALFYGISVGLSVWIKKRPLRVALSTLAWSVVFLIAFICCLALTNVNDIRFCDLLQKLIPLLDKL